LRLNSLLRQPHHFNLFVACNIGSHNDDRAGKTQRCPSLRRRLRGTKQEAGSRKQFPKPDKSKQEKKQYSTGHFGIIAVYRFATSSLSLRYRFAVSSLIPLHTGIIFSLYKLQKIFTRIIRM
jgi:hypothetical protein